MHPAAREAFHESAAPPPLRRLYYVTTDGWQAPLFCLEPRPGGAGEPVLLLHGLSLGPHSARYGSGATLAGALAAAGFRVYCATHRGDFEARGTANLHLDGVIEFDLPAAISAIAEDSGFRACHIVGHGLGGQLALMFAATRTAATITAIASPVRFHRPRSHTLGVHRALSMLPTHWPIPTATLARLASPWVDESQDLAAHVVPGSTPPPRLRGALHHTAEDVTIGIVQHISRWAVEDSLTTLDGTRDYVEAFRDSSTPLHLVHAPGDTLGHPSSPEEVQRRWAGPVTRHDLPAGLARVDCLLGSAAPDEVFTPVVRWLETHRREAW